MFEKRKLKREQELSVERAKVEDQFIAAIAETEQLKDPAEKIICLQTISETIGVQLELNEAKIDARASKTSNGMFLGGMTTLMTSSVASIPLVVLASGPVGWGVFGAGAVAYAGLAFGGLKRAKTIKERLTLSAADHTVNLKAMQLYIGNATDKLIEENVDGIRESEYREQMLELPGISQKFAAAAMNNIAELKKALAEKEEAAQQVKKPSGSPVLRTASKKILKLS